MKDKIKNKIAEIAAEQNLKGISRIPKAPSNLVAIVTVVSIARDEKKKDILDALQDKFDTVRGGGGIAYAVPLTGVIGVAIYSFLSNQVR